MTNNFHIPEMVIRAIEYADREYSKSGDVSATQLLKPNYQKWLELKYSDQIEIDASAKINALIGKAMHLLFEKSNPGNFTEFELTHQFDSGIVVSGRVDFYDHKTKTLIDYKTTKVSTIKNQRIIQNWTNQLNIYAWLMHKNKIPVDNIAVIAFLKNWEKYIMKTQEDYPRTAIIEIPIPLLPFENTENFVMSRVREHQNIYVSEPSFCNAVERWENEPKYAVRKLGSEKNYRVKETIEEAEIELNKLKHPENYKIETLEPEPFRCLDSDYCAVNKFCPYYKELRND